MIEVKIIGIGTGNPAHLTGEAIAALNTVDVFLVADKGSAKQDLVTLRSDICRQLISGHDYQFVEVADPERGPDRGRDREAYDAAVGAWHRARAQRYAEVITEELGTLGTVGFLVWGDPALYDSTIRIVESIRDEAGLDLNLTVVAGVSSVSLLAAAHAIVLNRVGTSIHITTGRRLLAEYSPSLGDVVVMLDGDLTCRRLLDDHPDLEIFWGAQLGLPDQALVAGPLTDVIDSISSARDAARQRRGWVMDTYLLRPAAD